MNLFVFAVIHLAAGLALLFFSGKVPKATLTFGAVFSAMSFLYWTAVLTKLL